MKTRLIILGLLVAAVLVGGAGGTPVAIPDATPTLAQLKAKVRAQANRIADLRDQVDAQDAVIADQNETITRLRARDPLDAIVARGPDGQWAAVVALYGAFPTLPEGALCGYDKSSSPGDVLGLSLTTFQFERWSGC